MKRVHFTCDNASHDKLESLKHLIGKKRDEILEEAINDRFREVVANLAKREGLLSKSPKIELVRVDFAHSGKSELFDEICAGLNLLGKDGTTASVNGILLEIENASVIEGGKAK